MLISHFEHGPVSAYPRDYLDGAHQPLHLHREAQLLYAVSGIMRVVTKSGRVGDSAEPRGVDSARGGA